MLETLRQFALQIAPELSAQPLYVVQQPAIYPQTTYASAYALKFGCPIIRQVVKEAGDWIGNGPAIVIIEEPADSRDLLATIVHETAHLVPSKKLSEDREPTAAEMVGAFRMAERWAETPEIHQGPSGEPWGGAHGIDFIRRALHLHDRALRHGHDVPFDSLGVAGHYYGLSWAGKYARALGDEPERMRSLTFAEIEATDPPQAFARLFDEDVERWRTEHQATED
ncbi:hypothetical protein [Botrimarina sp.]|uniref:hypothetical protein n=1 Tax=Botrimarina sp. TaxID=2795802 RepID=UPI0032EB931F